MAMKDKPRGRWWSRLHLLVRFAGLTGLLAGGVGFVMLWIWVTDLLSSWQTAQGTVSKGLTRDDTTLVVVGSMMLAGGLLAAFLALAVEIGVILAFVAGRRSAFGLNAFAQIGLAIALLIGVNVYSAHHYYRLDKTDARRFTLPDPLTDDLAQLKAETLIVVYQRPTSSTLSTNREEAENARFEHAAQRKVVEKVKDAVEQFRAFGNNFGVVVLDVAEENYDDKLAALKKRANDLHEAVITAPESSVLFYDKGKVQRLSFDEFLRLDLSASKKANDGKGNLVLLSQGIGPFAGKVLNLEERRPRIGIAVIHEVLTTDGQQDWGLAGLKKSLTAHGFEVRDIVLKRWGRGAPEPAAYTYEESKLDRLEARLSLLDRAIKGLEQRKKELDELQSLWKKATLEELTKKYESQLRGRKVTEAMREFNLKSIEENLTDVQQELADHRKRRDTTADERSKLNLDDLAEKRRLADVKAKMDRLLTDCDLLLIPRMTLRNVNSDFDNIAYRFYPLDETQVNAIQAFLKAGKPILACFGPASQPTGTAHPPDRLEEIFSQLGIKFGKQTVLFDAETEAYAEQQGGLQAAGGSLEVPPVEFDWKPGAFRPFLGEAPLERKPNWLRECLRITARAAGKKYDLRLRHPRPVYFEPDRGQQMAEALAALGGTPEATLASLPWGALVVDSRKNKMHEYEAEFMATAKESWNENQPFLTDEGPPKFEPPKTDDPAKGTLDEKRRGPFPIGVAIDTVLPAKWYEDERLPWPTEVRVAAIGQGGFFTGKDLSPPTEQLLLHTCNWLLRRDNLLPQDDRPWQYPRLQLGAGSPEKPDDAAEKDKEAEESSSTNLAQRNQALWHWGTQAGLPLLFAYFGLVVLLVRRLR